MFEAGAPFSPDRCKIWLLIFLRTLHDSHQKDAEQSQGKALNVLRKQGLAREARGQAFEEAPHGMLHEGEEDVAAAVGIQFGVELVRLACT